ncbi:MAG: sulfatase [Deltaproteobacteria bacterium]|nr:sulfatase [Deltaproteobacteria bacterium]
MASGIATRKRPRFISRLASLVGYGVLIPLLLVTSALVFRYLQTRFFYAPLPVERLEEKGAYLGAVPTVAPDQVPNFVVIFFDDLGWGDLSSYGNRLIRTPRIDALATEGVRMTNFYSASPVCTPSRAALLTGRLPSRTRTEINVFFPDTHPFGVLRQMMGWGNELPRDEILLPEALGAAGYATGMVGKWHLGGTPGHRPNDFGFDSWLGVLWSNDMTPLHVYRDGEIEQEDRREAPWSVFRDADEDRGDGIDQRRLTERYTDEAIDFLQRNSDRPFFLYFAHTFPHVPHFASREHAGRSAGGVYGDVVEDLDRSVGAVLDALDRLGLREKTFVIVTSDNGAAYNGSPGPLRGRKGETYEGGQRVPMIARWPGRIPAGVVTDEMAMNIDLFPTLLGAAGLPLPDDREIDGRDLRPLLEGRSGSPHDVLYFLSAWTGEVEAVRGARFKYRAASGDMGRSKRQLWLLGSDAEAHNLAAMHPEAALRLAGQLDHWRASVETNPRGWR